MGEMKCSSTVCEAEASTWIICCFIRIKTNSFILLSTTNKMKIFIIFFIIVYALHVSGGFSVHHQELKFCTHSIWYVPGLLAATASGSSKQAWHIPDAVCTVLELLMYSFKYNQQVATFYNILYYCLCSTCCGQFLRPSSGAQELYTQHLVCARFACCYR